MRIKWLQFLWGTTLDPLLPEILYSGQSHPFYINYLLHKCLKKATISTNMYYLSFMMDLIGILVGNASLLLFSTGAKSRHTVVCCVAQEASMTHWYLIDRKNKKAIFMYHITPFFLHKKMTFVMEMPSTFSSPHNKCQYNFSKHFQGNYKPSKITFFLLFSSSQYVTRLYKTTHHAKSN